MKMSTFEPETDWESEATRIMFALKDTHEDFTADDFYRLARNAAMPPRIIKKYVGILFKQYQAAGFIEKTREYRLSTRNGSSPLPVWRKSQIESKRGN